MRRYSRERTVQRLRTKVGVHVMNTVHQVMNQVSHNLGEEGRWQEECACHEEEGCRHFRTEEAQRGFGGHLRGQDHAAYRGDEEGQSIRGANLKFSTDKLAELNIDPGNVSTCRGARVERAAGSHRTFGS